MEQNPPAANGTYRLFVGNLGSRMTESELRAIVKPFGTVKTIHMVKDGVTGNCCGYAFVEMTEAVHATRVASELMGKSVNGQCLVVRPLF